MQLQLLDPQRRSKEGDALVTFGSRSGKPFVPGVPIGAVTAVAGTPGSLTRVATVDPYVAFTSLDIVGVVVEPPRTRPARRRAPGEADAGARPSPSRSRRRRAATSPRPAGELTVLRRLWGAHACVGAARRVVV